MVTPTAWSFNCHCWIGTSCGSMRTFCRPPMAINASLAPTSIPLTSADIATRLDTPRMMPSIVSSERNLCAQISLNPMRMALQRFTANAGRRGRKQCPIQSVESRSRSPHPALSPRWTRGEGGRRPGEGWTTAIWAVSRFRASYSIRRRQLRAGIMFGAPRSGFRVCAVQPGQFRVQVFGNPAVADLDAARRHGGDFRIVRDERDGPAFLAQFAKQFKNHLAGMRVQVARGFVGENDFWIVHQRAGDGGPLLLPAGKLHRPVPGAIFHLHQFERLDGALAPFAGRQTAVNHRQLDVLEHIELGQQIEELKHEPDLSVPDAGQLARRGVLDHGPVELDRAAGGRVE